MAHRSKKAASRPDEDNPEWTAEDFARARPAAEVQPQYIGEAATQELLRRSPGRPVQDVRKVNQTLRLDADVLEAYRQEGKGWQTRMNEVLRKNISVSLETSRTKEQIALILVKNFHIRGRVTINDDGTVDIVGHCSVKPETDTSDWLRLPLKFGSLTGNFDCTIEKLTSWAELPLQARLVRLTYEPDLPVLNVLWRKWRPVFIAKDGKPESVQAAKTVSDILQHHLASDVSIKEKILKAQKELIESGYVENAWVDRR